MRSSFYKKNSLLLRAGAAVVLVTGVKVVAHVLGWEVLALNPLFTGIVAANVFLMGFLLSGVLSDFKESERLPGELAAILETLIDEALILHERSRNPAAMRFVACVVELGRTIHAWFFGKVKTRAVLDLLTDLNLHFAVFEPLTQPNFITRMKQEQHALRRILIRIQTIRETSFISSGYVIAEVTTALLAIGLILSDIQPFYESLFVVGLIIFLLTFLIMLIRDLDNPFGYYEESSAEDVSLHPLEDFIARMQALVAEDDAYAGDPVEAQAAVSMDRRLKQATPAVAGTGLPKQCGP
jgi:hypothetical protein